MMGSFLPTDNVIVPNHESVKVQDNERPGKMVCFAKEFPGHSLDISIGISK